MTGTGSGADGAERSRNGDLGADPEEGLDGLSFEELVDRLEGLTAELAGGDLGIERAADLYERAQRLHATASARLDAVVRRIDSLSAEER